MRSLSVRRYVVIIKSQREIRELHSVGAGIQVLLQVGDLLGELPKEVLDVEITLCKGLRVHRILVPLVELVHQLIGKLVNVVVVVDPGIIIKQ